MIKRPWLLQSIEDLRRGLEGELQELYRRCYPAQDQSPIPGQPKPTTAHKRRSVNEVPPPFFEECDSIWANFEKAPKESSDCGQCGESVPISRHCRLKHALEKHVGRPRSQCRLCDYKSFTWAGQGDAKRHIRQKHANKKVAPRSVD